MTSLLVVLLILTLWVGMFFYCANDLAELIADVGTDSPWDTA